MTHIVLGHKVPGEAKRTDLQKLFPPWTVTREQYAESLSPKHSGISNDVLLFSEVGLTLVHHNRVHSAGQPHAVFRGKYLAQLRLLHLTGSTTPAPEKPLSNASPQVTHVSGKIDDSCARLRPMSEKPRGNAGPQVTHVSGRIDDSCARLRPPSETPLGNAGPQVTHVSGISDGLCTRIRPPSEKPLGNAGPQVTHMSGISDGLCARPRPPGRRRRSQRWIPNTATHVASRLTEQDPRMTAGAVVFDCRPAVLPVSVDVSGIDMQTVRRAEPPAQPVEQESTAPMWLNDTDPELEVTPLLDSGTDCQDELSSPDGSPMVISPIAGLLPSQGEDDINLARILAEFGTLPAFASPIMDEYAEREMPPTEYHTPELPPDLFVMPAGPGDGSSLTRERRERQGTHLRRRRGCQGSHYIRGVALRRRKSRRNFGCSLRRQRCFSQKIMRINFGSV